MVPGLRYCNLSDKSGEDYYHKILNGAFAEAFNANDQLQVILDGTSGLLPSFLDEAFGNLVYDFGLRTVRKILILTSDDERHWINYLEGKFEEWQARRNDQSQSRVVTKEHDSWYRLTSGNLEKGVWAKPTETNA